MTKSWQRILTTVILLLLLATAYNGIVEGLNATHFASTTGQRIATLTQLGYGVLALAAMVAMGLKHAMTTAVLVLWGGAIVVTALLAPVVYGGTSIGVAIGAGLASTIVVGLVILGWQRSRRSPTEAASPAA